VIVEYVPGDEDEVDLMLRRLVAYLLKRLEPGFFYPVARALLEPSDSQAQVKVCGVQEFYHLTISLLGNHPHKEAGLVFRLLRGDCTFFDGSCNKF